MRCAAAHLLLILAQQLAQLLVAGLLDVQHIFCRQAATGTAACRAGDTAVSGWCTAMMEPHLHSRILLLARHDRRPPTHSHLPAGKAWQHVDIAAHCHGAALQYSVPAPRVTDLWACRPACTCCRSRWSAWAARSPAPCVGQPPAATPPAHPDPEGCWALQACHFERSSAHQYIIRGFAGKQEAAAPAAGASYITPLLQPGQ